MEDCIRTLSFEDLKKNTIGQTYKDLNILLRELNGNINCLQSILTESDHLSIIDESIKLIVIDSCQLRDQVISILLNQNNYPIKRILNCTWFFAKSGAAEEFCNNIFPCVSTWTRIKLFNKLSKGLINADDAEKLFNFVNENYNRAQAELFLPKCSSKFIQKYFQEEKPLLQHSKSCRILLAICRRFPAVVINLFSSILVDSNQGQINLRKYEKVLLFLASNHSDLFIPFFTRFYSKLLFLNFGKKLSKKIGQKVKHLIFESDILKSCVFNKSGLISAFDFNDQVKFLSILVKSDGKKLSFLSWVNNSYQFHSLLKIIKPESRLSIIESVFRELYNLDLWNHVTLCQPEVLELIPLGVRLPLVEAYEKQLQSPGANENINCDFCEGLESWQPSDDPENFIYLYPFEQAFSKLKEALFKAPTLLRRQDIVDSMIRNCSVNKYWVHLEEIVDFVAARFRNDSPAIYIQFIYGVFRSAPLESVPLAAVKKIEEMLHLCFVKNECHSYGYLLEKCMLHRLNNNLDVTDQVKQIVDWSITDNRFHESFIHDYCAEHSRVLLMKFYSEIVLRMKAEKSNKKILESTTTWILSTLKEYNKKNKKKQICLSDVPDLVPFVITYMEKHSKGVIDDVCSAIDLNDSKSIYMLGRSPKNLIRRTLKKEPQAILKKLPSFITHLVSEYSTNNYDKNFFFLSIKVFSLAGVMPEATRMIADEFHCENNEKQKQKNALIIISHIYALDEFEKFISEYMPRGEKIDQTASAKFTEIQLLIPELIKNLTPSWKNTELIFKFFIGDFFPRVLTSFYACSYRTRVDLLIPLLLDYLHKLPKNSKIAIKKELIRVLLNVSDFREAISVCRQCWNSIDHYSIRSILLRKISSAFVEHPTQDIFEVLKQFIEESDEIVIDERPVVRHVSRQFFSQYVMLLWKFSDRQQTRLKNEIRKSIISDVGDFTINLLPPDFCQDLIKTNLFKNNLEVSEFTSYYLIGDSAKVEERVRFVVEVIKGSGADIQAVSDYFKVLRSAASKHSALAPQLFENFLKNWPFADKSVLYDDRLMLYYHYMYHKIFNSSDESTIDERSQSFGRQLNTFYGSHSNLPYLIPIFMDTLKTFLHELKGQDQAFNLLAAFKELLRNAEQLSLAIFVTSLLPADKIGLYKMKERTFNAEESKQRNDMAEIVQLLKNFKDDVLAIYFYKKFGLTL